MELHQQATNLAHEVLIVYLLHSIAGTAPGAATYLNDLEAAVLETLPSLRAIQEGPHGLRDAIENRLAAIIDVVRNSIPA